MVFPASETSRNDRGGIELWETTGNARPRLAR